MTEKEINEAIGEIAEHYGAKAQTLQLCEECGELIQAVSKLTRGVTEIRISALAEEIADVRIMMSQLMQLYGIPEAEVVALVEDALTAMRTTYRSMSEMLRMWHIGQVEIS